MITALQLIFSPFQTWERITTAQRGFLQITFLYLLPLLIICIGVEGYCLTQLGEKRGEFGYLTRVPQELAIHYAVAYFVFLVSSIVLSAKFLALASESFNVRTSFLQAFTVMAYGFGPLILARLVDAIPQLNT